jgi:hypothetical protein
MPHQRFESCIKACYECGEACNHCAASCLQEQDVKMMARCIALDMDCAEICALAAAVMSRASESSRAVCTTCAGEKCGQECAKHQMEHCQQCAASCRRCAEECRKMAAMA